MECLHIHSSNSDTTEMNQAALIYALLFNRAFLYAVNRKGPLSAHELMCKLKFERGNAKSGYQDESMQDNECDDGEPEKMSSSDDSFSENIRVDLDDPGIWKAKGVKWTLAIGLV
eukprot:scaffold60496_cov59-Attheya_sp.AAC.2